MKTNEILKIGIYVADFIKFSSYLNTTEKVRKYLSQKDNPPGQRAVRLADYLVKNSNYFDSASFILTDELNYVLPNGTFKGLQGLIYRSEIDIAIDPYTITAKSLEKSDFPYPFKLYNYAFMTRKPEYIPQIFDIFHTFSTSIWISIFLLFILMLILYYATFKRKYSFDKISLQVFAIFLKQGSILRFSSISENLLLYSLVVGAMFLALFYESTVLSFLTIPPINKINDLSQLATAVANGKYHCIAIKDIGFINMLLRSERAELGVIGRDLQNSNLNYDDLFEFLTSERSKQNLAFVGNTESLELNKGENKIISEDRFLEGLVAMMIRKDFCCKKLIETFIHRLMASGIYFKENSDQSFLHRLRFLSSHPEMDTSKRKLTLVDFAPAFIFLLIGHFISFLALFGELLLNRNMVVKFSKINKKRKNTIKCYEEPV